jgi:hypothetical protein
MAEQMPYFAGGSVDAVAEYKAFIKAVGDDGVHLLAELIRIHNQGNLSDIPTADKNRTNVRDLNCRCVEGWAVFYAAPSIRNRCQITVIHVGKYESNTFGVLESEAEKRQRNL